MDNLGAMAGQAPEQDLQNFFQEADKTGAVAGAVVGATGSTGKTENDTKKEEAEKALVAAYEERKAADTSIEERAFAISSNLALVNTLGLAGQEKDFIVDQEETKRRVEEWEKRGRTDKDGKPSKKPRALSYVPAIVGYRFQNIGTEPIVIQTKEYAKNADGKYVGTLKDVTVAPQGTIDLSKVMSVVLMSRPEVSAMISNAILVNNKAGEDRSIEGCRVQFSNSKDKPSVSVHDASVKVIVDEADKKGGAFHIKKEFLPVFGFCENEGFEAGPAKPKTASARTRKPGEKKVTRSEMVAAWAAKSIAEMNLSE